MLESPLPQWVRNQLTEMIDAHLELIPLLELRCTRISVAGRRNADGDLCDASGTLDEYRVDGKYVAGQAVRLLVALRERLTDAEWDLSPYSQVPRDPGKLAEWAWANPWKHLRQRLVPAAMDEAPLEWRDFYLLYPDRERRALTYTLGCGMTLQETADKMGVTVGSIKATLARARARGRSARDVRVGIKFEGRFGKRF